MLALKEWLRIRKRKVKKDEQRSNQTHGEGGNFHQQREVTRSDTQVTQQTVHLFPIPELQSGDGGSDDLSRRWPR